MKSIKFTTLAFLLASSFAAQAGFVLESANEAKATGNAQMSSATRKLVNLGMDAPSQSASLVQEGVPPFEPVPVKGFGRNTTVHDSLRQLVPLDWKVFTEGDVDLTAVSSWKGDRSWFSILGTVFASTGIKGVLNWNTKELVLFQVQKKEVAPARAVPQHEATLTEVEWVIDPAKTLRENLDTWVKKEGWTLAWNATYAEKIVDYKMNSKIVLKGPLLGEKGALAKLIGSYSDAEYPLAVESHKTNRVIEVKILGY